MLHLVLKRTFRLNSLLYVWISSVIIVMILNIISILVAEWILFEPWDSQLNLFVLYDQDPNTCLNLIDAPLVHTLHSKDILQHQAVVRVVLPENLETSRHKMIKVLKSDYENIDMDYSLSFKRLMECEFRHGNEYLCICEDYCQLFVRITTAAISVQGDEPVAVCEIQVIN